MPAREVLWEQDAWNDLAKSLELNRRHTPLTTPYNPLQPLTTPYSSYAPLQEPRAQQAHPCRACPHHRARGTPCMCAPCMCSMCMCMCMCTPRVHAVAKHNPCALAQARLPLGDPSPHPHPNQARLPLGDRLRQAERPVGQTGLRATCGRHAHAPGEVGGVAQAQVGRGAAAAAEPC